MPDVDSTLRQITQWKHIITTDLMSAFYQIPLALHFVGSGCMPVQRWACLAQKLPWRNSCVLPCEIEALSIAAAKHFSPYIIQLKTPACILTDSKPCVQSFEKLCPGEFSSSPRVATFLSTVSRYQASVHHVAGAAMLPSDFASRNAPKCDNPTCQVCSFIQRTEDSVVLCTSVQSILSGTAKLPFTTRAAWLALQAECPDLRRTHAHLTQGHALPRSWQTLKM